MFVVPVLGNLGRQVGCLRPVSGLILKTKPRQTERRWMHKHNKQNQNPNSLGNFRTLKLVFFMFKNLAKGYSSMALSFLNAYWVHYQVIKTLSKSSTQRKMCLSSSERSHTLTGRQPLSYLYLKKIKSFFHGPTLSLVQTFFINRSKPGF